MKSSGYVERIRGFYHQSTSDIIAAIVTFLAIAGLFVPIVWVDQEHRPSAETFAMILALAIFVFGDRVIDIIRTRENKKELSDLTELIETRVSQAVQCRYMGMYGEALEYVKTRLLYASAVKDLTIVNGILEEEVPLYFHKAEPSNKMAEVMATFVNNGKVWRGIISENIKTILIDEAYAKIDDDKKNLLNIRKLNNPIPVINFTIIEYDRGSSMEVLFGWGHHKFDDEGHVFCSTDPLIVRTFDRIYQALSSDKDLTTLIDPAKPLAPPHIPVSTLSGGAKGSVHVEEVKEKDSSVSSAP